jgi:hypothetical protein
MKKTAIFIASWLCLVNINGQSVKENHMNFSGKESLEINIQIADSIDIITWNKNEVYTVASVNVNENKDNDAYEILFEENGLVPSIKASFRKDYFKNRKNCCTNSDIRWKIYIPDKAEFSLETINADVTIKGETGSMKVKSISGFIDLAISASRKTDAEFSTISGTVYSNLNIPAPSLPHGDFSKMKFSLNGGGPLIRLETISGDIFFRKSN